MDGSDLCSELKALHPESYGWALCCCARDRSAAEEAVQSAYLKVLEGKATYDGRSGAERNPHGYFPAWSFTPGADKYDTVYNPVSYDRGITSIWADEARDRIGREKTSRFVAAQARWCVFSGQLLDTLEMDNVTAIRACNHGGHTNLRNQIGIYLYDDFGFYRGLIGDLVAWSAASELAPQAVDRSGTGAYRDLIVSNAGSPMVRWGLNIRPGGKWLESTVEPLAEKKGFKLRAWNRLPLAKPMVKVTATEAGLAGDTEVMEVQLVVPSYREPAEFEVTRQGSGLLVKVSKPAKLRLAVRALRPDWPAEASPIVRLRQGDQAERTITEGITWERGELQWGAVPSLFVDRAPLIMTIDPQGSNAK